MRGFTNGKWLSGLLTVSLAAMPTCIISAEENNEVADQYIIVELEPVSVSESDTTENASETEPSTEEIVEAESNAVLFSLEEGMNAEEYSVTGISANEPIVAQLLAQTEDYQDYDTIALYDLISHQQIADEPYDFSLQIPENADITLYQSVDGQLQKSTLDAAYTEEEYNRLPLISYQSKTNHWLVLHLGVNASVSDSDTEDAARATESAAESLEGKTESETEAKPSESEDGKKHSTSATEQETTKPNQPTTKETESTKVPETKPATPSTTAPTTSPSTAAPTKAPETKPAAPSTTAPTTSPSTAAPTKAPETQPQTTAHTHAWVPVTKVVHHDATYKDVWVQDSAAWDETVVTKEAWDEQVLVSAAWDETVVTKEAWDEPVYGWGQEICNVCGYRFPIGSTGDDIEYHALIDPGCGGGWHSNWEQIGTTHHDAETTVVHHDAVYQTVHHEAETTTVHHDATGHTEKVVDQAAWDETVITGYTCSGCGATKEK